MKRNTGKSMTYEFLLRGCSAVAAGIGCIALAGWLLELPLLAGLGRGLVPMAPSTAILFVAYGMALLLAGRALSARRPMLFCLAVFTSGAIISALLLVLSIQGVFLAIEHFGTKALGAVEGSPIGHMSPITAVTFLLLSLAFPAVLTPRPERGRLAKGAWWLAVLLFASYVMLLLAYLFGTPMFYGGDFIPPAATTSLAFIALTVALAAQAQPLAWPGDREAPFSFRALVVLFLLLVAGIISAGYFYHRTYRKQYLAGAERQLSAIADLKSGELMLWREERLADASLFHNNASFATLVQTFLQKKNKEAARREIAAWIGSIQKNRNYDGIILLDARGDARLSLPTGSTTTVSAIVRQKATEALRSRQITIVDFYRNEFNGKIYLSILVPLFAPAHDGAPLGVLALKIDPEKYLYPFIQRWPNASATAETLLVRKEGREAVFLNELKFSKNAALNLKLQLDKTEIPAVMTALGREGVVRGIDYRGHPVLAALRNIPDTPWHLVARMDEEEIYAPLQERLWITVLLISAMLLSAGTGFGFIWRQQSMSYYKRSELQLRRSKERLQCLLNIFQFESNDVKELLDFALNEALGITSSKYGYIYYYDEIMKQFVLNSWSNGVMQACSVADPQSRYDLDLTGIWGEAVRQRRPIVVNDFNAPDPLKKGYPEGHVPLTRFLTIPHIDRGKIVAVVGVANKESAYDDYDILQLTLLMGSVWKIAERKQKERELEKKNAELERFTYTVSHDLKSPLVTIKTFLGYLEADIKTPDNPRVQQDLGFMHNAADKMAQLLNELLELSRVGRLVNPPQQLSFMDLVSEAVQLDAGRISDRGVTVEIIESPVILFGDRARLVEIWQNLVENAVKYSGDAPEPHIEVGCALEDGDLVFFVRDNGIGIDPRYHEKVFSLFDKLDANSEGTGLGLALVRRIVEMYGGRIWVDSKGVGHGSCFRFTLPEAVQNTRLNKREQQ